MSGVIGDIVKPDPRLGELVSASLGGMLRVRLAQIVTVAVVSVPSAADAFAGREEVELSEGREGGADNDCVHLWFVSQVGRNGVNLGVVSVLRFC